MAPLVVKGKVLVGNSGGEIRGARLGQGARRQDGRLVWTAYSTGPDQDVLIGPDFKPFYDMDKGKDLGVTSWPPDAWQIGGGTMWGWISYDPELEPDLSRHRQSRPVEPRPAARATTSGPPASSPAIRTPAQARWFYQWSPHDLHDYDGINEQILLDMQMERASRARCSSGPSATATSTSSTERTGEVLSAEPFGSVNSTKGVDLKTGRLIENPDKKPGTGKVVRNICPTASGRQGLAALGLLAAHRLALHPAQQSLHGRAGHRGELHRRHALRRHERADDSRSRRPSRRIHRLGHRQGSSRPGRSTESFPVWSGAW